MFVHRINWPRTRCITYRKRGNRGSWPSISKKKKYAFSDTWEEGKCVFFLSGLIKIANLSCKEMLRSYRGSLRTEIAFWLLFISCYDKVLIWKLAPKLTSSASFKKSKKRLRFRKKISRRRNKAFHDVCPHWWGTFKGSVKSLQGNKGKKLFYCLLSFLLKRFK